MEEKYQTIIEQDKQLDGKKDLIDTEKEMDIFLNDLKKNNLFYEFFENIKNIEPNIKNTFTDDIRRRVEFIGKNLEEHKKSIDVEIGNTTSIEYTNSDLEIDQNTIDLLSEPNPRMFGLFTNSNLSQKTYNNNIKSETEDFTNSYSYSDKIEGCKFSETVELDMRSSNGTDMELFISAYGLWLTQINSETDNNISLINGNSTEQFQQSSTSKTFGLISDLSIDRESKKIIFKLYEKDYSGTMARSEQNGNIVSLTSSGKLL